MGFAEFSLTYLSETLWWFLEDTSLFLGGDSGMQWKYATERDTNLKLIFITLTHIITTASYYIAR